jgi:4-amino-4-deoxy-L-arabinose transferase-like glycosyltransferase
MIALRRVITTPTLTRTGVEVNHLGEQGTDQTAREPGNKMTGSAQTAISKGNPQPLLLPAVLALVFLLGLGLMSTERFGESYDDGIYVTTAKSLATGAGYSIISVPAPVPQILIPPFYPFVLSLVWRAYPHFPDNLFWMMLLSIITMVGFLGLTWQFLVEQNYATRWQALAVVALIGVNWRMMTLATSLISEILFALLSAGALYLAEKYEKSQKSWILGAALGLVMGLAFLTRTSGLVLIGAVAIYFVLRRQWKKVLLPVAIGTLFVAAWFGWCYLNRNAGGGVNAAYYAGYVRGTEATFRQLQALNQTSRLNAHLQVVSTNAIGLILVWLPLQTLGLRASMPAAELVTLILFFLALFCGGLVREIRKGTRLVHIYLALYLALHLVVPSHSYERYLMPVSPFLLLFPVSEISALFSTLRRALATSTHASKRVVAGIVGVTVLTAVSAALYSNATGIYLSLSTRKPDLTSVAGEAATFEWIKANTDPSDVLVCFADPKFYLFTGRKVVRSITVNILDVVVYQERESDPEELLKVFLNIVDENKGSYLVVGASDFENQAPAYGQSVEAYIEKHSEQFVLVFQSVEGRNRIYRIQNRGRMVAGNWESGCSIEGVISVVN